MKGIGISSGIAMGKAYLLADEKIEVKDSKVEDIGLELENLDRAMDESIKELEVLYAKTKEELGSEEAEIFTAHKMMLTDPEYLDQIKNLIEEESYNGAYAVEKITNNYIEIFSAMEDEYLRERAADFKDISSLFIGNILGKGKSHIENLEEEVILIAKEITPSDTAKMDKDKVLGFVSEIGGETSHSSIIARSMSLPAVSGIDNIENKIKTGDYIILDGNEGRIYLNPDKALKDKFTILLREEEALKKAEEDLIGKESISLDGFKVELASNIGTSSDLDLVLENDSEGIGLYRTEFIYMDRDSLPFEEEQFEEYKKVVEAMDGKPVIIRTLDIGGDKDLPYLNLPEELNPFLGYRAIRISLKEKEMFKEQLRAILRASAYGQVKIMFPMISNIGELREAKKILDECRKELDKDGISYDKDLEVGIMVEIPSVAIESHKFAKEVDFFSIGTNDLVQYTLAVDRGNDYIANLYTPFHPAVLRLIKLTIDNGHKEGIWVGMCGEAAGNPKLIPLLLGMGLDEFSMNPSSILRARSIIRQSSKKELEEKVKEILELDTSEEVLSYIEEKLSY